MKTLLIVFVSAIMIVGCATPETPPAPAEASGADINRLR
jgi:uncharacterized protein YcfL